jgi:pyruvate dehydrogenase E1 component alpha subunit
VIREVGTAFDRCRAGEGPTFLSINTYRFRGHSMSDPLKYRPKEEAEKWKARDPIITYGEKLKAAKFITDADIEAMQDSVNAEIDAAIQQADADPQPALEERFDDILAETYPFEAR